MRVNDTKSLGEAVRQVRRATRVTQAQLALTSGTHRRFVLELERGKRTAQIGKVLDVLRTLGIAIELTLPAEVKRGSPA